MAWTWSAVRTGELCLAAGLTGVGADMVRGGAPGATTGNPRWSAPSLQSLAKAAGIAHLALLASGAAIKFAVAPAEAAAFTGLTSQTHMGLLVLSGTLAAVMAVAAGRQSSRILAAARSNTGNGERRHLSGSSIESRDWAELAARVSHELRTPLNAVIGFSDVMQRELLGPIGNERYREYIGHIRDSGFALLKSAEDTAAMTSLIAGAGPAGAGSVDIDMVIRDAWRDVAHRALDRGVCLTRSGLSSIEVQGTPGAMKQALINLFSEAIRVAPPKGKQNLQLSLRLGLGPATNCSAGTVALTLSCKGAASTADAKHLSHAPQDRPDDSGLSITMAHALLQLQGHRLKERHQPGEHWCVVCELARAERKI